MFSNAMIRRTITMGVILAIIFITGCSKKQQQQEEESTVPSAASADENVMGDSDSGKAMGLQTVSFPYDSFILTSDAKAKLQSNADLLKSKPSIAIEIEGHCDQRGGIQYNIALGEKRAGAVKKYMEDLGVRNKISTISFGKEKLLDPGTTEEAYAKNRRANFVITSR